jgi:dihydroorotate dehydrogenase electron transfer subunit
MLRRPLSLAGRRDLDEGRCRLDIIYRVAGTGTRWLAGAIQGDQISILGPLGNGFTLRDDKALAVLVGGGVGIPPMIYLASALAQAGRRVVAFNGARTRTLLPLTLVPGAAPHADGTPSPAVAEFAELGVPAAVATDDGSLGFAGLVSHAFENWLNAQCVARASLPALHPAPADLAVYSCGPEPMMRAVARTCLDRGIDCQLALERHMACGMGACQSCVVKVKDAAAPDGWSYKLCCTDGPVFDATQLLW